MNVTILSSLSSITKKLPNIWGKKKIRPKITFQSVACICINLYSIKIVWTHFSVKKTSKRLIKQDAETKKEESEPHLICRCSELNFYYIVRHDEVAVGCRI